MEQSGQGTRFLLLTGAPRRQDLSWTDADLIVELQPCFQQRKDVAKQLVYTPSSPPSWRELHLNPKSFHSGFSQHHFPVFYQGSRCHIDDNVSENGTGNTIPDVTPPNTTNELHMTRSLSLSAIESFLSTSSGYSQVPDPSTLAVPIIDLSSLPSADQLEHLPRYGQPLINLLGVVLAGSHVQSLKTRYSKTNGEADLIRLFIADDTRTNFELSLWLDGKDKKTLMGANQPASINHSLREAIESLQTHDIVLFQNMALRVFQNRVTASSVRGLTFIKLLYRDRPPAVLDRASWYTTTALTNSKVSGNIPNKIRKILEWRDKFLEPSVAHDVRSKNGKVNQDQMRVDAGKADLQLPEDTQ